jgi:hypothetical protein
MFISVFATPLTIIVVRHQGCIRAELLYDQYVLRPPVEPLTILAALFAKAAITWRLA